MPAVTGGAREERPLIFVSNRGPLEHYLDEAGEIRARKAGGGVAVALSAAAEGQQVSWIAGACGDADRAVARTFERLRFGPRGLLKLVPVPEDAAQPYYNSFCNPILWFIQHGLSDELVSGDLDRTARDSWLAGYLPVNRLFAAAVVSEIDHSRQRARVMLHDYHLYMAPRFIRRARPETLLQQFIHIPWPEPQRWQALPSWIVREVCKSLLANDSLAFQTEESATNFVATCDAYLAQELVWRPASARVSYRGRSVHVWSNPIAVDPIELASLWESPAVASVRSDLARLAGEQTIVRVDRLDPSKNVLRGFQAYDLLLRKRPDLQGRVKFLAFLVPSRSGIPEYDSYVRAVFNLIDSINRRYGTEVWTPITVFHEQNRPQAIAGLGLYDVLLVNSVADGMNLVSKEGPLLNERDGVLCLSTNAGSYEQLRHGVIAVNPLDVRQTAQALETALELRPEVRSTMAAMTRAAVESHQLSDWLRHLLQDIELAAWRKTDQLAAV
jgi:trehalose 6-phosphate synthase